jgi:1-aminocyclopropane-1-carboxylate deaminase
MLDQLDACPVIQIDQIDDALFRSAGVAVRAARLDLIDASINGNKWYKLCCNLQQARKLGIRRLLSFGGAWSNHLHALAAAGARFGFETIGIVRGEPSRGLTPTLADAQGFGMRLHFVDRSEYRRRDDADYVQQLAQRFAPCLVIPEGGGNQAGVAGCEVLGEQLLRHRDAGFDTATGADFNHVVCASATGGTASGLARGLGADISLHAICVLHAADTIRQMLTQYAPAAACRTSVVTGYEFGGYARVSPRLLQFVADTEAASGITLEPVYTGKALFALYDRVAKGEFAAGSRILFVHTGGLQGRRSWNGRANGQYDFAWHDSARYDSDKYNDNYCATMGTAS